MIDQFKWQTEDESDWLPPTGPGGHRRRWSLLLFAGVIVLGVVYGLYRLSVRQLTLREQLVKSEIWAAHSTWMKAVEHKDLELMTVLSARADPKWYTAQRLLLMSGRMLDRDVLGLVAPSMSLDPPNIALSPDMTEAEVSFYETYEAGSQSDAPRVVLEQTAFYEKKGSLWAQRPLTGEEWGATRQIATQRTVLTYRERDQAFAGRLASDLDRDLGTICTSSEQDGVQTISPFCDTNGRIRLEFITDPQAMLDLVDGVRPALVGLDFQLPSPTLVGLPVDDAGYLTLYHGYVDRILQTVRQARGQSLPPSTQHVATLCVAPGDSSPELNEYDPAAGRWISEPTDRTYRYLRPMPSDDGLILRAGLPGVDLDRLQLSLDRNGQEQQLVDVGQAELSASLASFTDHLDGDGLVLRFGHGSTGIADYAWTPLTTCDDGSCELTAIEGYPVWAPGGEATLISEVGQLLVGDGKAKSEYSLGAGYSPFWLSPSTFGFVALPRGAEVSDMQVVVRDLVTGQQRTVTDAAEIMDTIEPALAGRFRIRYATASPADPSLIIIGGSLAGVDAEDYLVVTVRLTSKSDSIGDLEFGTPEVILRLPRAPEGDPAIFTTTGNPPFSFSADGHWLVAVSFVDKTFNSWELTLVDPETRATRHIATNYPPYPAHYPYFDWSADGQWLVLVDNGFLRLISSYDAYERIVPHELGNCTYTGWINP